MPELSKARLAELQKQVKTKFEKLTTTYSGEGVEKFQQIAKALSLFENTYYGPVILAGQCGPEDYEVQFNAGNVGYSSSWPQWAFEYAKTALLSGRNLLVISQGPPMGENLLGVFFLALQ